MDTKMKAMLASTAVVTLGVAAVAQAAPDTAEQAAGPEEYLESFAMTDPGNVRKLDNGEYMFRMGRDTRSGAVYWARMGNAKHIIVTVPDADSLMANDGPREAVMTVADLPKGFGGCDWDGTHTAYVTIVPDDFAIESLTDARDRFLPTFGAGQITFNRYGRGPMVLHAIENHLDLAQVSSLSH